MQKYHLKEYIVSIVTVSESERLSISSTKAGAKSNSEGVGSVRLSGMISVHTWHKAQVITPSISSRREALKGEAVDDIL